VEVILVTPPTVALAFEKYSSRNIPIRPAIEGKPALGYIVGKTTADPPTVDVEGPESAVQRVTDALTEPVSVAGAVRAVQETVTVGTLDPAVRVKTQRTVQVTVQVIPAPLEHTVRDRPVLVRNLGANLMATVVPTEVDVTLRGSREALARIQPDDATAYVDLTDMVAGEYTVTVHADSSRDAGVTRIDPAAIAVRITSAKN
jgi:YbbR domain-containing protein